MVDEAEPRLKTHHIAKAETITRTPTFRGAIRYRRCLVLADAFFESVRPESRPDDCPPWSRDRTCRPIGSTLGGQSVGQRTVEKPSEGTAAVTLRSNSRGEHRSISRRVEFVTTSTLQKKRPRQNLRGLALLTCLEGSSCLSAASRYTRELDRRACACHPYPLVRCDRLSPLRWPQSARRC
jgi:hypothetical protein